MCADRTFEQAGNPLIQTLCDTNDVLCLQERLLTADSLCLLSKTASTVVISRAARHSGVGRPSGGTAILARNVLMPEHFRNIDYFTAVKIQNYVLASVYLPTDYRNATSDRQFDQSCHQVSSLVSDCELQNLAVILAGDMNYNLFDDSSSRANILNSMCPQLLVVENTQCFTYIHNSGSTSSPDFFMYSPNVKSDSRSSLMSTF